jgi:hypothetical protein
MNNQEKKKIDRANSTFEDEGIGKKTPKATIDQT